jgi:subtilisin family serine protease
MNKSEIQRLAFASCLQLLCLAFCLWPALLAAAEGQRLQRYIIELHNPAIAAYRGEELKLADGSLSGERLRPMADSISPEGKLDVGSVRVQAYADFLQQVRESFLLEAAVLLGRVLRPELVYQTATNGLVLHLSAAEAVKLEASGLVMSLRADSLMKLNTEAGPRWLGTSTVWGNFLDFENSYGEGVVIGIIDSGINWEHPAFADPSVVYPSGSYHYTNPYGSHKGLCGQREVACNNKLVGVYDFVQDDPSTDYIEESNDGRDNDGHGSHVASIAGGNLLIVTINGIPRQHVSGVAPRANLVSYRVCFAGDANEPGAAGCQQSAILSAIDQAISDGVDVINYSIGTEAFSPWQAGSVPMALLNARMAGIFVATSAGNSGPNPGAIASPGNAPWVVAAGNATHNEMLGNYVLDLSGGATEPPAGFPGATLTPGIGVRKIVHARDYGNALCGTGTPELGSSCATNLGLSNPWKGQQPFNGEIVVCDRGTYGSIEKGKNVMLAGAGAYILANTSSAGESVIAENHCLPASHLGASAANELRTWLATGDNHMGSLSAFDLVLNDSLGDILHSSSSRGPNPSPVQGILKPDLVAPGTSIIAASHVGQELRVLTGSSMASAHIAGAAALVRAIRPSWTVAQVVSTLETTTTTILTRDFDVSYATTHERGSGRPRLARALKAGLYLDVSGEEFIAANPATGGVPGNLNLPTMAIPACKEKCIFTRTVTDQKGGGSWTARASAPPGVEVRITPANFTLADGASRTLTIELDVTKAHRIGQWIEAWVLLTSDGSPEQRLTIAAYSTGGSLPAGWKITDDRDTGSQGFRLDGLVAIPDLTLQSGGFVAPTRTVNTLKQDPTSSGITAVKGTRNVLQSGDPYNGVEGVFTAWHNLPEGGLWLHAETLASSAVDIDLFMGRDNNGDGVADAEEELCSSIGSTDIEQCDLYSLPGGNYWIVVQNWKGTNPAGDQVTLLSAAIARDEHPSMVATGQGIAAAGEAMDLRVNWRNVPALPGEEWLGALSVGTRRDQSGNLGVIPIRFSRSGIAEPQTFPLFAGETQQLALAASSPHQRVFLDVPPGTQSFRISASGDNAVQSNNLKLELFRQDLADATASQPFASLPGGLPVVATGSGGNSQGPSVTLGSNPVPGRYYVRISNNSTSAVSLRISSSIQGDKAGLAPFKGLWRFWRDNYQGGEYNSIGANDYILWYSFDHAGQPTFYNASAPRPTGNVWVTDVIRYTNDGAKQQAQAVGKLSMTFYENDRVIYSYSLMGLAGSDLMAPLSPNTCPRPGGLEASYHGTWGKREAGLGGATVNVYNQAQSHLHYLFDGKGIPRFLLASDATDNLPNATSMPILHYTVYCATCQPQPVSIVRVGTYTRNFTSEDAGSWTLDYQAFNPLQTVKRTDDIVKISDGLQCD